MTHGSLFSGIGGFDLAAEWMGWENVFHCEWNEFGKKVLNYYWPKAISYHDITKTDFTIHRGTIDILTGGFPCQPYSSAGKRKGKEDERHLWPEMLRAIREIQPRWVVGENVLGLVNWSGGLVFHEVQADLEAAGYEVWPYVLPAVSVNAPHRRDRVWFVAKNTWSNGRSNGKHDEQISKRNIGKFSTGSEERIFGNEIEQDAADTESQPGEWMRPELRKFSQQEQRESGGTHSQMGNNVADTERIRLEHSTDTGKVSGKETNAKREWNQSALPVKTNGNGYKSNWQNFPTQSPICSRNDGISSQLDGITFSKWRNESIKAAGNAIVPQVVYQIFKAIEQYETLPRMADSI
jgi:DNA (cytosine-5)-methyltransferase 1